MQTPLATNKVINNATDTLTPFEVQLLYVVRNLKPYEKVELKLEDNRPGKISVSITTHTKEVYLTDNGKRV